MTDNNVKKLCAYCIDCVKCSGRNDNFLNILKNDNLKIENDFFESDDKNVIKFLLNKNELNLYYACDFIANMPLLYCEAELKRIDNKIVIEKKEELNINISLISSLLDNEEEEIEKIINDLLEIEEPSKIDFEKFLNGLLKKNIEVKKEEFLILSKTPENIIGLLSELNQVKKYYENI